MRAHTGLPVVSVNADRARAAARRLRDQLKSEGREFDANVLQELIRSCEASLTTNRQLYLDNLELREHLMQAENRAIQCDAPTGVD